MKKYGVSETRQNLTSLLKGNEFQIIDKKTGQVLATVLPQGIKDRVEVKVEKQEIENKYKKNIKRDVKDAEEFIPVGTPCIHGLLYHRGCHY
jgi:hypothetical protein